MHRLLAGGAIAWILLFWAADALACLNDRDCPAASRCVKTWGQADGVCQRGVEPIQGDDWRRIGDPNRPKGTEGQTCELTVDCASGLFCVAQPNTHVRICSR